MIDQKSAQKPPFPSAAEASPRAVVLSILAGMFAPMALGGPIHCDWFDACVVQVFGAHLRAGDMVVMNTREEPGR